jgi:hypothetical protein
MALLLLSSCDLFKVRESDPPGEPPPWNDYAYELTQALANLGYCYTDSRNKIHYGGLFTDNYMFHFAPQDINDFSIEPTWNRTQEQEMIQLLHNRYTQIELDSLKIDGDDQLGENEAKFYSSYIIRGVMRGGGARTIILANGNMELHFRRISGYWYIEKWYDYRGASGSTWGKLKHENS